MTKEQRESIRKHLINLSYEGAFKYPEDIHAALEELLKERRDYLELLKDNPPALQFAKEHLAVA